MFLLFNVPPIQFKFNIFLEIISDEINIFHVSERQMVNFVGEVKFFARLEKHLDCFWIVMTTDMEVSWNFVNKYESTEFASFFFIKCLQGLFVNLLSFDLSPCRFFELVIINVLS